MKEFQDWKVILIEIFQLLFMKIFNLDQIFYKLYNKFLHPTVLPVLTQRDSNLATSQSRTLRNSD